MARKSKAVKTSTEKEKIIELEGKRKSDNAWYECQVSLGSATPSCTFLNVHFASFKNDETDIIQQEDEVMARLRVRSTPLSDGECLQVKEGEAIIALQKTQSGRCQFFDAEVEKVQRLKHSNKVFCRCTFEIRWLESKMKGDTVTVPASSIKRLVHESIQNHPVISAFLKAVQAANRPSLSLHLPSSVPPEDSDIESDLHDRLEQQIEEIAKLADTSENASTEEIPLKRTAVNVNSSHCGKVTATKDCTVYDKDVNKKAPVRKSARKRSRVNSEVISKDPATVKAAALLHIEKRPRLSPLAARAALAAAVWNLPLGKQNMNDLSHVLVAKKQDSIDPLMQNSLRKQLDKVSLNLSDAYFDIRSHRNYNRIQKRAISSARGKSSKQSRGNNFCEYPDTLKANPDKHDGAHKKHLQIASADHSMMSTQSISVSAKQEASSGIASTAKGRSPTAGVAFSLTKQRIRKRHKEASKEGRSTWSKKNSARVIPIRTSPRFQMSPLSECNKQQPLQSQKNRETGKHELIAKGNVQREQNGPSIAARVKGSMPIKIKKQLKGCVAETKPGTLSTDTLEAKHLLNEDNNENFDETVEGRSQENGCTSSKKVSKAASVASKVAKHSLTAYVTENSSQAVQEASGEKSYNTTKRASKAALTGAKKAKHLPKDANTENITEAMKKRPKDNHNKDDKKASVASSVKPKKIEKLEEVPTLKHVECSSLTNNSTKISLRGDEQRTQNDPGSKKRASKAITSRSQESKKTVTSTHKENSNGKNKAEYQPFEREQTSKSTGSQEGENSRKDTASPDKNLKAQIQSSLEERKHASRKMVARSSPRLRFLPRTRSQSNAARQR